MHKIPSTGASKKRFTKGRFYVVILFLLTITFSVSGQYAYFPKLSQKTVPLDNSVYALLKHYEARGVLEMLPASRPYTNSVVVEYLQQLRRDRSLSRHERYIIDDYLEDFSFPVNGFVAMDEEYGDTYAVMGAATSMEGTIAAGYNASWNTVNIFKPFIATQFGNHITLSGAMGMGLERLTPDLFYESWVKDSMVYFPYASIGYSCHPYTFDYQTMYGHIMVDTMLREGYPLNGKVLGGLLYEAELSSSWWNNALQVNLHNNRRSWGFSNENLMLSGTARSMPGLDLVLHPARCFRYYMLVGSLFHYANKSGAYKADIYGYDLGSGQRTYTLQMVELIPVPWLQVSMSGGSLSPGSPEAAHLLPYSFLHFSQLAGEGNHNLFMGGNIGVCLPGFAKVWFSLWVDSFSLRTGDMPLFQAPSNRFGWQCGGDFALFPLTTFSLRYTRLSSYLYTHAPVITHISGARPVDMTYTHDGANLGFPLPPNSVEFKVGLSSQYIRHMTFTVEGRYLKHGTNNLDAAASSPLVTGDVYSYLRKGAFSNESLEFGSNGLYDHIVHATIKAEQRIRRYRRERYYRIYLVLGASRTWWESNASGITVPAAVNLFTLNTGFVVDF